jgi:putative selenate reductase
MDAARVARRLSGGEVTVAYRRTRAEMPASEEELLGALEEGVELRELVSPVRVLREGDRLVGLELVRNELGEPGPDGRRRPVPILGSEFTLPADAVIVAIGQQADLTFLSEAKFSISREGNLSVEPETGRIASQIYAGGDVTPGPHTIIAACGDGLRAACAICQELGVPFREPEVPRPDLFQEDVVWIKRMRARKEPKWRPPVLPPKLRRGFEVIEETYGEEKARAEASRCLRCSALCDKCVEVCPNRANVVYFVPEVDWRVPVLRVQGAELVVEALEPFRVTQSRQILHIDDLCNECGNCATFCVHQGKPYLEKPRLFLSEAGYHAEFDNAFRVLGNAIYRRVAGKELRLEWDYGGWLYEDEKVRIRLTSEFAIRDWELRQPFSGELSLRPAAEMAIIWEGAIRTLPFLGTRMVDRTTPR